MTVGASLRGFVIPANAGIPTAHLQLVGPDDRRLHLGVAGLPDAKALDHLDQRGEHLGPGVEGVVGLHRRISAEAGAALEDHAGDPRVGDGVAAVREAVRSTLERRGEPTVRRARDPVTRGAIA